MPLSPEMRGYNRIYKEFEDIYRDIDRWAGLSASAFGILYHLMDLGDGCLQRDICAEAFVSKQTVNSSIRTLERQGLIRLTPGRGRDMHIHFTEKGRRLAEETILPVMELENAALQAMDPGERQALMNLTAQYLSLFEEKAGEHLRRPPSRRTKPPSL